MTEKISVIVPVYNSEKTLADTCRAILNSSYENIELILVDDGSSDTSASVIQTIANKDSRVITISKENGGPSSARNAGIRKASGKYIAFCDSDDIPHSDMYATLLEVLQSNSSDLALCEIYSERDKYTLGFPWEGDRLFSDNEVDELIASMIGNENDRERTIPVWGSVCRGLYLTDLILNNSIFFPEDIGFAEDLVFSIRYLKNARRASVINRTLYTYCERKDSIMNSYFSYVPNMLEERLRLLEHLDSEIRELVCDSDLKKRLAVTARSYFHGCVGNACRLSTERDKRDCKRELKEVLNCATVREAFERYSPCNLTKRIIYTCIKYRFSVPLFLHYFYKLN